MGNLPGASADRGRVGALQGLVAAGETPPDAAPSPLSISVATLGVTLHLSTAGKWLGPGLGEPMLSSDRDA